MTRRGSRGRAGITLTEILISILIMGVGLVSLATLFPLGLLRLRAAAIRIALGLPGRVGGGRHRRAQPAGPGRRSCRAHGTFPGLRPLRRHSLRPLDSGHPVCRSLAPRRLAAGDGLGARVGLTPTGSTTSIRPGLPVAYDPLWRAVTGVYPGDPTIAPEARFASGIGRSATIPNRRPPRPRAHGLQRLTNFPDTPYNNTSVGAEHLRLARRHRLPVRHDTDGGGSARPARSCPTWTRGRDW